MRKVRGFDGVPEWVSVRKGDLAKTRRRFRPVHAGAGANAGDRGRQGLSERRSRYRSIDRTEMTCTRSSR